MNDVLIIGGGLAGLVSALQLARAGLRVGVIEKKTYPFHRVCGEYLSNEVLPFVQSLGVDLDRLQPARITRFQLTSPTGKRLDLPLDLGGFGLSRYALDEELYRMATAAGATFQLGKSVEKVIFENDAFSVTLSDGSVGESKLVIGAFGKRSRLDKQLDRAFIRQHSPYVGVKYHVRHDFPKNLIALHNFKDGYCGISAIENEKYCLCYLTTRENLRQHGHIEAMEEAVLHRNPHLKRIFTEAQFLYDKPEVINEISFAPKQAVENHVLMAGDAAGLITPLCGNGMAMAIHAAQILSLLVVRYYRGELDRPALERAYRWQWQSNFARRLWVGRRVQRLFGDEWLSESTVRFFNQAKPLARLLVKQTHGKPF
ncbi:MAG: FAD-dependent monooxygenase [Ferruginibacter sp.]|nr:FAD-dependent monooxygenase [Cytophagales bacterium]